jgi:hypothetical protein
MTMRQSKRRIMKRVSLSIFVIVAGLVLAKLASAETNVIANINCNFVAGGKTHSAGRYKVYRLSSEALVLQSEKKRVSIFLHPSMHKDLLPGQQPKIELIRSKGVYYLSEVQTDFSVYTLAEPDILKQSHQELMVQSTVPTE